MPRYLSLPAALAFLCSGCASVPAGNRDARDPFESYNRAIYRFNDAVDRVAVKPVAQTYVKVVPQPVRLGVSNFFRNMAYPRTIINDFLQVKIGDGTRDTARLVVNSVAGLGGIFDPATHLGLDRHEEDFGQTLGHWGVPSGPYLMLPVLGPSTVRDAFGRIPDEYTTTRHYISNSKLRWSLTALDAVDARANLLTAESLTDSSFDRYAFIRNAWLQRREYLVKDGDVDESPLDERPDDSGSAIPATVPVPRGPAQPGPAPPGTSPR